LLSLPDADAYYYNPGFLNLNPDRVDIINSIPAPEISPFICPN